MSGLRPFERLALAALIALCLLAGLANYLPFAAAPRFVVATLALAALAWLVSLATEQVAAHSSTAKAGFLHASMGNLPELFVVLFALGAGEVEVAQTAIVGSLLANSLLVLGTAILIGAWRAGDGVMRFSGRLPNDTATLLLVTAFIIVLVGLSLAAHDRAAHHVETISIVGAICLLAIYALWSRGHLRGADPAVGPPLEARVGRNGALALLAISGIASGFVSDWFVNSLHPAIATLGFSRAFLGIVIIAIADNAIEHASSVILAWRGRNDLAIAVVKSSVAQIAAFLFPLLVLISAFLPHHLTFAFAPVYIGAITLMALALRQVTGDGEASAFEGLALVALYVVIALVAALD